MEVLEEMAEREREERPWSPEDKRTIHERMVAIISELPEIGKGQWNSEQRFAFRGYDDVMNALKPLLSKHGVFIVPNVIGRKTSTRTTNRDKTMYEVNLHVEFTFYGAGGDSITASGWGEGTDMGDKATNKAMTGAFKYVLFQVFAIATGEIPDADQTGVEETTRGGSQRRSQPQRKFDPSKDLMPQAIAVRSVQDADDLRRAQRDLDPEQDWIGIENYLAELVVGAGIDHMNPKQTAEYWIRLANAVARSWEGGEFPPPSHDEIKAAYAWAFDGHEIELKPPGAVFEEAQVEMDAEAAEAAERDAPTGS